MAGFTKDCIYYRADTNYGYCSTSGYLGENCPDGTKLINELKNFLSDPDGKTFEIVRHEAKAGDGLAHVAGVELRLERKNGKIIVIDEK